MDFDTITARMQFAERCEILHDAILIRAGLRPKRPHPHADELAATESCRLFRALDGVCSANNTRSTIAAFQTTDFAAALSQIMRSATIASMRAHTDHRQFCDLRPLPNFNGHDTPYANLYPAMGLILEGGEAKSFVVDQRGGVTARISTYGADLIVSRQLLVNDDVELLGRTAVNTGACAARREARGVYTLLEANPNLGDGSPVFDAAFANLEAAALDATSLASAIGKLRNLSVAPGEIADITAKTLLVAPGLEYTARKLVTDAALDLTVIASGWIAAGRWYLFGDPADVPVIALFHLSGARDAVSFARTFGKDKNKYANLDGVVFGARLDFGVAPVGRLAIKGGV